jgi:hypothetical protein
LKHKKCCGTTRARERELTQRVVELARTSEAIAALPHSFPRLRPDCAGLSAWADRVAVGEIAEPEIDDALALIDQGERRRIERRRGRECAAAWALLAAGLDDEELATEFLLAGGVVAVLGERRLPDPDALELIEEEPDVRADPCESLAFAIDECDLWSIAEGFEADGRLAAIPDELDDDAYDARWHDVLAAAAADLETRWHRDRLELLVGRLRERLPIESHPVASAVLADACERFRSDTVFRRRLAALLLSDMLDHVRDVHVRASLAA